MKHETLLKVWMRGASVNIEVFFKVSIMLTEMVINYHKQHELIGILTPSNIKLREDFKLSAVTGTTQWDAAYRAPEYSGRLNISPDERSDLYALGVIFYELLAKKLPFHQGNSDEDWINAHMLETPRPLSLYRPELDETIESIILKLLAKSPNDRYQTGWGLLVDLKHCAKSWKECGNIQGVDIGCWDHRSQFCYPSVLFGREDEINRLTAAYKRVVANDSAVMVSVRGVDGVGKTSLVDQFLLSLDLSKAMILTALCTQERQSTPFGPIYQAVGQALEQLWGEGASDIEFMREIIERELGNDIYVLLQQYPEVNRLMEFNLPVDALPIVNSASISHSLAAILRCFSHYRKPLILYIDQLHYADEGTIEVIQKLNEDSNLSGFMCICLVHEESNDLSKSIMNRLSNPGLDGIKWTEEISLKPLVYNDVRSILVTIMHEDSMSIRVLARSVYDQTHGNPASIKALLVKWFQEKQLYFNEQQFRWTWELQLKYFADSVTAGVLHLYENGYNRLSDNAKQLLKIAAIVGFKFQSAMLSELYQFSHQEAVALLEEAEKEGLVYCEVVASELTADRSYAFMHPSLQQKLILIQDEDVKVHWHYRIGELLKSTLIVEELEEQVILVVEHLNRCIELMPTEEILELAKLNYRAGVASFYKQDYVMSNTYTKIGVELLERLGEPIIVTYDYYMHLAYSEYMSGNEENMHKHMAYLMSQRSLLTREMLVRLSLYQLEMFTLENNEEAVEIGRIAFSEYGWQLPERVSVWTVIKEVIQTQLVLKKHFDVAEITSVVNDDQEHTMLSKLVITMSVPLLFVDPLLLIFLFARFIRYGLKKGSNQFFLCIIANYDFFLQRGIPFIQKYLPSGAIEKIDANVLANEATEFRLPYTIGMYKQLTNPRETMDYLYKAARRAFENDDVTMGNLSLITMLASYHGSVNELMKLISYINSEVALVIDEKTRGTLNVVSDFCSSMQDEQQLSKFITYPLTNEEWMDVRVDSHMCLSKLEAAYYGEQYEAAIMWANKGQELVETTDWLQNRKLRFFEALSWAGLYPNTDAQQQHEIKLLIRRLLSKMKKWTGFWGRNSSAYLLIQAELNRMHGNKKDAFRCYEAAIKKSRKEQYFIIEAITLERVHDYHSQTGILSSYHVLLIDACSKYSDWGVHVKVNLIKQKHSELLWYQTKLDKESMMETEMLQLLEQDTTPNELMRLMEQERNDDLLVQIVNWSDKRGHGLLDQFLRTVLFQLGADRGCIIKWNNDGDGYSIDAYIDKVSTSGHMEYSSLVSQYVKRTGRPVLLDKATHSMYARDPYIRDSQPASILCTSMGLSVNGVNRQIYVENRLISGVFTEKDLHVLELLITRLNYVTLMEHVPFAERTSIDNIPLDSGNQQTTSGKEKIVEELIEPLTPREIEVLTALSAGYSNKEIAAQLVISEATVKTHIYNIYGKLQVKRRGQAIARAKELEIV